MAITIYLWYLIAAILSALSMPFIKQYSITNDYKWILFAVFVQLLLIVTYIQVINSGSIGSTYAIIKVVSIILVTLFGIFIFNETLDIKHKIAILLAMVSIYLLSM